MLETKQNEQEAEGTPVFGSWRRVYWFVGVFFVLEVIAFYFITKFYS